MLFCIHYNNTATTTTILQPLCRSTCISQHLQLRSGWFFWCRVLLPACLCPFIYHTSCVLNVHDVDLCLTLNIFVYTVSHLAGENEVNVCHWFCIHCLAQHVQFHVSYFIIICLTEKITITVVHLQTVFVIFIVNGSFGLFSGLLFAVW